MSGPRVFVVDDHAMVRAGVRAELGDDVTFVGEAPDVPSAVGIVWTSAKPPKPAEETSSEIVSTRRGPMRSINEPAAGPPTSPATDIAASTTPAVPSEIPRTLCR